MKDYCKTCKYDDVRGIPGSRCSCCVSNSQDETSVPSRYISKETEDFYQAAIKTAQELDPKTREYIIMKYFKSNITGKMPPERFQELLDELDGNSLQTLKEKNARYSSDGDSLHNFRSGAEVAGGTPAQACWGYMTKHLVALRDMVMKNDFSNREDFLEKCQDTINYIRFLWCIGNDENK